MLKNYLTHQLKTLLKTATTGQKQRNQPCIQVCGTDLDIWVVDMCKNNLSTVAKTERGEPSDYTPISFEAAHHPWLLVLQQP